MAAELVETLRLAAKSAAGRPAFLARDSAPE